ncbi:MAG: hypothetical protein E7162_03505 [Firmicutes bacterium]|nr:hypothetical protein [Bacillota bacterium]
MKKMINEYINFIEEKINTKKIDKSLVEDLLVKISFFQHERIVHFLVTMLVGLITVILLVVNLFIENIFILILLFIFICLLIPYMFHYYFLENKVQYLYKLYDKIKDRRN